MIGALAGSFIGYHLRSLVRRHLGCKDWPLAVAEDVVAIGLSLVAMGIVTG